MLAHYFDAVHITVFVYLIFIIATCSQMCDLVDIHEVDMIVQQSCTHAHKLIQHYYISSTLKCDRIYIVCQVQCTVFRFKTFGRCVSFPHVLTIIVMNQSKCDTLSFDCNQLCGSVSFLSSIHMTYNTYYMQLHQCIFMIVAIYQYLLLYTATITQYTATTTQYTVILQVQLLYDRVLITANRL